MPLRRLLFLAFASLVLSPLARPQSASVQSAAASAPTAVPPLVAYLGAALADDGKPLTGEKIVTFLIYKEESGAEPLWAESQTVAVDSTGHYKVQLGAASPNGLPGDLFSTGEARWLEVQVAGQAPQNRVLLASVPYALKASDAMTLGGLPASAFALAGGRSSAGTAVPAGVTSNAATDVTTTGGTSGYLSTFTGADTIADSIIFQNAKGIGINDIPNGALDVTGVAIFRGPFEVARTGNASTKTGYPSNPFSLYAQVYDTAKNQAVGPYFSFEAEPTDNNTSAPGATLNVLYNDGLSSSSSETGLHVSPKGVITFASGQRFPGADITGTINASSYELGGSLFATGSTSTGNAYLGFAGNTSSSGTYNTGIGNLALRNITGGIYNTASGFDALLSNTTGDSNTANGADALLNNTTANYNTANGVAALANNTTGDENTASGSVALLSNTTGFENTANGYGALLNNTTGHYNTANGVDALFSNNTANDNTANGVASLYSNTTGYGNVADGFSALGHNTTGFSNTANGDEALLDNTTGVDNTAVGESALSHNNTGNDLTAVGAYAQAGEVGSDQVSNATALGAHAAVDQNNSLILGQTTHGRPGASFVNVGIGTAAPRTTLEVAVNAPNALGPVLTLTNSGQGGSAIDFNTSQPAANSVYAPSARIVAYNNAGSNEIAFQSRSGQVMQNNLVVSDNGSVYIPGAAGLRIDNPADPGNKYLVHSSVESSEMMNIYSGNVTTDELGLATVTLPKWFEAENADFRYQLTVLGQFAQAIVKDKIANGQFRIMTNASHAEVSWQITAVRQDSYAKAHPLVVEQLKAKSERAGASHPEFGQPASAVDRTFEPPALPQPKAPKIAVPAPRIRPAVARPAVHIASAAK